MNDNDTDNVKRIEIFCTHKILRAGKNSSCMFRSQFSDKTNQVSL